MGNYCGDAKNEPKYPTNIEEKAKIAIDIFFEKYFPIQNKIKTGNKKGEKRKVNKSKEFKGVFKYMEVKKNQEYFLFKLDQYRAFTQKISEEAFNYSEKIFSLIMDSLTENNKINNEDLGIFQKIIVLSETFFYEKTKKEKIFLHEKLKDKQIFHDIEFWKKYSEYIINKEIDDSIKKHKIKPDDEERINIFRVNSAYSKLIDIIFQLKTFGFEKNQIIEYIDESIKKYGLKDYKIILDNMINQ